MAAVHAPLSAANPLISVFSPFSNQHDPTRQTSASGATMSPDRESLEPPANPLAESLRSPATPSVAPSPVSDVGTLFADMDEMISQSRGPTPLHVDEQTKNNAQEPSGRALTSPLHRFRSPSLTLKTSTSLSLQASAPAEEAEPQSVIHVPSGFGSFNPLTNKPSPPARSEGESDDESESQDSNTAGPSSRPDLERARADSGDSVRSDSTVKMPHHTGRSNDVPLPPTPLQTTLPMTQDWSSTPRAQTRSDLGALSRPPSSLASILEGDDLQPDYPTEDRSGEESDVSRRADVFLHSTEDEIAALRNALSECWTLCNTLASLSYIHRERIFAFPQSNSSSATSMYLHQQQAWKSCWKLCQNLYDSVSPTSASLPHYSAPSRPTLDLCREFCACLFDARARDNETADSVLRVSFELNNHLFNTHDRSLPEAFRERTLDFYITLCHRLMKQKARLQEETDSLLRACWSLAEMLFSLRQNAREGRRPDEELLGSAVQACWELCDLFREGWTQIRPERGTPRPSQTTFTQAYQQALRAGFGVGMDDNGNPINAQGGVTIFGLPETPTTIFEDTGTSNVISPDDPEPQPNILVLGADAPAEMGLRSTSSTPAPYPGSVSVINQQQMPQRARGGFTQMVRGAGSTTSASMLGAINATNMGQTPMSAHPATTNRRFWSSTSSAVSAASASEVMGSGFGGRTASTITRTTHNTHDGNLTNHPHNLSHPPNTTTTNPNTRVQRSHPPPSSTKALTGPSHRTNAHNMNALQQQTNQHRPLHLLKLLLVKAALVTNRGFDINSSDPTLSSLPLFVKSLPDTAFGTQVWQVSLVDNYRKAIANDPTFHDLRDVFAGGGGASPPRGGEGGGPNLDDNGNNGNNGNNGTKAGLQQSGLPPPPPTTLKINVNPIEVARAVRGMTAAVYGFGWLRDLYRLVWGFYVEEALMGDNNNNNNNNSNTSNNGAIPQNQHQHLHLHQQQQKRAESASRGGGGGSGGGLNESNPGTREGSRVRSVR